MIIALDQALTAAVGACSLLLGAFLNRKINFLSRVCIPTPVTGGLVISTLTLALKYFAGIEFTFDKTLQDIAMLMFFTTVGFQCDFSAIKKGGRPLLVMILLIIVLIFAQNALSVGIASAMGLEPVFGMVAGSIPMCGGHGTAAGFNAMLEAKGIEGAASITMATATFGLIAGSLIGGPLAEMLIRRRKLSAGKDDARSTVSLESAPEDISGDKTRAYTNATLWILIAMGLGALLNKALALTGISFPTYFSSLVCAIIIRNITECLPHNFRMPHQETTKIGSVCLALFLGMAMCSLRLWELAGLAMPLCTMMFSQALLIFIFCTLIAFPLLGRDYNAAVLVGGLCGFGLGTTPNAMANMSAICKKHGYSALPFIIVPVIGATTVDIINIAVITLFMNFL